jgi:hypothetical protein
LTPLNSRIGYYFGVAFYELPTPSVVADDLILLAGQLKALRLKTIRVFEKKIKETQDYTDRR